MYYIKKYSTYSINIFETPAIKTQLTKKTTIDSENYRNKSSQF